MDTCSLSPAFVLDIGRHFWETWNWVILESQTSWVVGGVVTSPVPFSFAILRVDKSVSSDQKFSSPINTTLINLHFHLWPDQICMKCDDQLHKINTF